MITTIEAGSDLRKMLTKVALYEVVIWLESASTNDGSPTVAKPAATSERE